MHASNNSGIKILGAIILRFSDTSQSGQTCETQQIVYITNDLNKLFPSQKTWTALGIISSKIPTVGEAFNQAPRMSYEGHQIQPNKST